MTENTQKDITRVIKEELQKTGRIRENNEPIENIKITNDHAFYKLICEKEAHSDLSSEEFNLLYNEISEKMISRPFTIKEINDFCTQKNIKTFSLEELLSLVPREVSECYVDYENNSVKDHNHGYIGREIKIKASYQNADLVQDNSDQGYITDSNSYYKFIYNKMAGGNIRSWVLQNLGNKQRRRTEYERSPH
ncbi:MAG: hypothetical protein KTV77_02245 [Wolbachia endosymbiont of Fragariocoptes setiger]|nr:hypothetical protein [Wolbachia endosymbiont of Fragariocoptes setiger]